MAANIPLTTSPFETLTTDDGVFDIDSLSPTIQALITDFEAPDFIAGPLTNEFKLLPEQRTDVARFLMEVVLGRVTEADAVARLSNLTDVDLQTAQSMLDRIESDLLAPNDLSISGLISKKSEPQLAADEQGSEGLRYVSLDDLMADLEPLDTKGRMRFLEEAKPFNRIFVLQALSSLKLGAGSGGQSLSFRELALREGPKFSSRDWVDVIHLEPDVLTEPGIASFLAQTPLGIALEGKNPIQAREYLSRVAALSPEAQTLLVDRSASSALDGLVAQGALPATHKAAATKIISFLVLGDVVPSQTPAILEKLGLSAQTAARVAEALNGIATPVLQSARPVREEKASAPKTVRMRPILPLTQRLPPIAPASDSSKQPGRNIIDLRKQQTEQ